MSISSKNKGSISYPLLKFFPYKDPPIKNDYFIKDNTVVEIKTITLAFWEHVFDTGDELSPNRILDKWENSEYGQWVRKHYLEPPTLHKSHNYSEWKEQYIITVKLSAKDATFWQLKWGTQNLNKEQF